MKRPKFSTAIGLALIITSFPALMAQDVAKVSLALPYATKGKVEFTEAASTASTPQTTNLTTPLAIIAGGKITTDSSGSATVTLSSVGTVQMERNTEIQIPAEADAKHSLELLKGKLFLQINGEELQKNRAGEFRLKTPTALLAVKGTRFFVECGKQSDTVGLHEGSLSVLEPGSQSAVLLVPDQGVTVSAGSISAPRPLSSNEKNANARQVYQHLALVKTPLLICSSWASDAYYKNKAVQVSSKSLRDWEHLNFYSQIFSVYYLGAALLQPGAGTNNKTPQTPLVSALGEVHSVIPFAYPAVTAKSKKDNPGAAPQVEFRAAIQLHLKGNSWRAKNAGLSKIGDLVGLQLHFKLQNIEWAFCSTTQILSGGEGLSRSRGIVLTRPQGAIPDQEWENDCIVPILVSKSGENSGPRIYIYAHSPEGVAGKQDKAEITLSKMVLVSQVE